MERRGLPEREGPGFFVRALPALLGSAVLLLLSSASASGQADWNDARAQELIDRARERRAAPYEDSTLVNYRADATGFVYFYLNRDDTEERTLVKADQVALEVYWAYPGETRQRIVGLRDESVLPNRMRYHLDHLTVVQNEFGDRIRLGDGDEVQSVPHPVAPGAGAVYDYRLADSLTLRLGGVPEPLRVYEIEVRPRHPDRPAIIGSLFLDRATADIVRMDFTFTPASYVDARLDYIRISLENGLWQGRFWLPYQQRAELRRQLPALDFPAGGVIRARMRVGNYEFNQPLPEGFFRGPEVSALPEEERQRYPFEEGLFSELDSEGLESEPRLDDLAEQAASLMRQRYLSGLPRLRLDVRGASSVLRYNRAEGLFLGGGMRYALTPASMVRLGAGYAFGMDEPQARLSLELPLLDGRVELAGWYHTPRHLDDPTIAGAMNTLSSLAAEAGADFGYDFHDLYFARGGGVAWRRAFDDLLGLPGQWQTRLGLDAERHVSAARLAPAYAPDEGDELDRPLPLIQEGDAYTVALALSGAPAEPVGLTGEVELWASRIDGNGHGGVDMRIAHHRGHAGAPWRSTLEARLGSSVNASPPQRLAYLGGRGTVAGYSYRSHAGTHYTNLKIEVVRELLDPWLNLRLLAAAGWADRPVEDAADPLPRPTDGLLLSVGAGVGIFHDILRLDLHRGLTGSGEWELLLSVAPRLRDVL